MFVSDRQVAFVAPVHAPAWKRWLVLSPLARLVIFLLVFHALGWTHGGTPLQVGLGQLVGRVVPALAAYLVLTLLIERRTPQELLSRTALPRLLAGLAAGVLLFSAIIGVLWLLGAYRVVGVNPHAQWVSALLMVGIGAGVGEEIMFRGVLYRLVEEGLGSWAALIVSGLFFGAAHIGNPGATLWAGLAIAIEAGILFGLVFLLTRSLWICIGLHAAWNFTQGTVYGVPVSGFAADGWLVSVRNGPAWLTGGAFGAEASVVALCLCLLVSVVLLRVALRHHLLVPPAWRRSARPEAPLVVATPA
jgi:hypothetical protein